MFSLNICVNSDHILRVLTCELTRVESFGTGPAQVLCEHAVSAYSFRALIALHGLISKRYDNWAE